MIFSFSMRFVGLTVAVAGLLVTALAYPSTADDEKQRSNADVSSDGKKNLPATAVSEKTSAGERSAIAALVRTPQPVLTSQQEDQALAFAHEHHRELADLLVQLRRNSSSGFAGGIRDVYSVTQRLERIREKQPERFEYELTDWKLGSEIRLLTARWVMSQDPELETRIRSLLKERQQARLERLRTERVKVSERLENLDSQIATAEADLRLNMDSEWTRLAGQAKGAHKTTPRPSRKSGSSATPKTAPDTGRTAQGTNTNLSLEVNISGPGLPVESGSRKKQVER